MSITVPLEGFGGGSNSLNFKIVGGTSAPASPKENTIWVNTDTEITGWIFSATEPEALAEGMVWISTGVSSSAEFNALKSNTIEVYPISTKQYVSGAWVDKAAKIYKSGLWTDWATYLYNEGDECTDITSGWSFLNPVGGGYTLGSGVKAAGEIQLSATNYTAVSAYPSRKIDLTNYSQLIVEVTDISFTGGGSVQFAVSDTTSFVNNSVAELKLPLSVGEHTLDVSHLTGYYYIGVSVWSWVEVTQRISFKIVKMR